MFVNEQIPKPKWKFFMQGLLDFSADFKKLYMPELATLLGQIQTVNFHCNILVQATSNVKLTFEF